MRPTALQRFRDRASAAARALFPGTLRIGAVSYAGATSGVKAAREIAEIGFREPLQITFRVRRSLFGDKPVAGTACEWVERELALRIKQVLDNPSDPDFAIECEGVVK